MATTNDGTHGITVSAPRIRVLRAEALAARDESMVETCDEALADGPGSPAWETCARVIAEAMAQDETQDDDETGETIDSLDAVIDDCTVSCEAAAAIIWRMIDATPGPSGGHGDAYAASSGSARQLAGVLRAGDCIGYLTRDAIPEPIWHGLGDALGALDEPLTMTDQGNGMDIIAEQDAEQDEGR